MLQSLSHSHILAYIIYQSATLMNTTLKKWNEEDEYYLLWDLLLDHQNELLMETDSVTTNGLNVELTYYTC